MAARWLIMSCLFATVALAMGGNNWETMRGKKNRLKPETYPGLKECRRNHRKLLDQNELKDAGLRAMDNTKSFALNAKDGVMNAVNNPTQAWEATKAKGIDTWNKSVGLAEQAGIPSGTAAKVAAGVGIAAGVGLAGYCAKKIGGALFGSSSKSGWPCQCCRQKVKRNSCSRCSKLRPRDVYKPWVCKCESGKNRRASDHKCDSCGAYQMWSCQHCLNPSSMKQCKKCKTKSHWRCECRKNNSHSINVLKCTKCREKRPDFPGEESADNSWLGMLNNTTRATPTTSTKKKVDDKIWLGVFPNQMSGIIVLSSCAVMVMLGTMLSIIFCRREERYRAPARR